MATDKPRFTITLDDEMLDRVEQFQEESHFATRSKAIQKIILHGLEQVESGAGGAIRNIARMPRTRSVPRVGTIVCGTPILAEENVENCDQVPGFVHCDFTLRANDNSMIGVRIHDGDIVCIRQQPEVANGQIAAVLIENEVILKRVHYVEGGIVLMPENSDYAPLIFTGNDINKVKIIGLVTHFISTLE